MDTPADILAGIGRTLYGEHWRLPLARGLGISDETIRRWMGNRTLAPTHGVFDDALALLRRRAAEHDEAAREIAAWIDRKRQ